MALDLKSIYKATHIYLLQFFLGKYSLTILFYTDVLSVIMAVGRVMSRKKTTKSYSKLIFSVGTAVLIAVQTAPPSTCMCVQSENVFNSP